MSVNSLRKEVLKSFKDLHRMSLYVFQNNALVKREAKKKINEEFRKFKHVTQIDTIKELVKFANEVTYELKTSVAEVEETKPGVYSIKLRPEMFEPNAMPSKMIKTESSTDSC